MGEVIRFPVERRVADSDELELQVTNNVGTAIEVGHRAVERMRGVFGQTVEETGVDYSLEGPTKTTIVELS